MFKVYRGMHKLYYFNLPYLHYFHCYFSFVNSLIQFLLAFLLISTTYTPPTSYFIKQPDTAAQQQPQSTPSTQHNQAQQHENVISEHYTSILQKQQWLSMPNIDQLKCQQHQLPLYQMQSIEYIHLLKQLLLFVHMDASILLCCFCCLFRIFGSVLCLCCGSRCGRRCTGRLRVLRACGLVSWLFGVIKQCGSYILPYQYYKYSSDELIIKKRPNQCQHQQKSPTNIPDPHRHSHLNRHKTNSKDQAAYIYQPQHKKYQSKSKQKSIQNIAGQQKNKKIRKTHNNQEQTSQISIANDLSSSDQLRNYVEGLIQRKLGSQFVSVLAQGWINGSDLDWLVKDVLEELKGDGEGVRYQAVVQQDQQCQQEQYSNFQCTSSVQFTSEQRSQPDKQLTQPFILQISQIRLKEAEETQNKPPIISPLPNIDHYPNPYKFNPHPDISLYLANIPIYRSQINLLSQQLHQQKIIYHRQQQNNYYYISAEYKLKCKLTNYQLFIYYGHGCNSLLKMACQHAAYEVLKQVYEMFPRVWRWFVMVKAKKGLN